MASTCFSPIKSQLARITRLDVCGNPVTGAGNQVVFDGYTQIQASPEYEEGEEFITKKANGALCVNKKDPNELKRVGLQMNFCTIDPDVVVMMTGERLLTTGGPVTGTGVAFGEGLLTARFSVETWQPIAGQVCNASGVQQYAYWVWANVGNAMLQDFTFENGPFEFTISGDTERAGTLWGQGPGPSTFTSGPKYLPSALDPLSEHFAFNVSAVPLPTVGCGAVTL